MADSYVPSNNVYQVTAAIRQKIAELDQKLGEIEELAGGLPDNVTIIKNAQGKLSVPVYRNSSAAGLVPDGAGSGMVLGDSGWKTPDKWIVTVSDVSEVESVAASLPQNAIITVVR